MPENAEEESLRQLKKLERMHPDTAETATLRNWLDIMTDLPWSKQSKDNLNLKKAERILNEDHYGLDRVKERIIEALAVRKLMEKPKGSILCLVGPPGVGKTSLGRSVARALNRKFVRLILGGLHDEAEIRGHRRTYVGAMPGRIIQAIQQAATNNPLIMLDEIDKVGADFRGDPSSGTSGSARSRTEFDIPRQLSWRDIRSLERNVHDDGERAWTRSSRRFAIAWRSSRFPDTPRKKSWRSHGGILFQSRSRRTGSTKTMFVSTDEAFGKIVSEYTRKRVCDSSNVRSAKFVERSRGRRRRPKISSRRYALRSTTSKTSYASRRSSMKVLSRKT